LDWCSCCKGSFLANPEAGRKAISKQSVKVGGQPLIDS
jgi:hypothetical protein